MTIESVHVEDYESVLNLYNTIKVGIKSELNQFVTYPKILTGDELTALGFTYFDGKYFHPELKIQTKFHAKLFFKLGNL